MKKMFWTRTILAISFICLISLAFVFSFYTYDQTKTTLKTLSRNEATALASLIATELSGKDGDTLKTLKPGDETGDDFIQLREKLQKLRDAHQDIMYLYTLNKTDDDIYFAVDTLYGDAENPGKAIGEKYGTGGAALAGFEKPTAEEDYIVGKDATMLSGYAPILDSNDETVGLVDVEMDTTLATQNLSSVEMAFYMITGIGILIAGLLIFIFYKGTFNAPEGPAAETL
jgi:sensor histidine kinase regulating citrate/malate metabolism